MRLFLTLIISLFSLTSSPAQAQTSSEILSMVDSNLTFETRYSRATMTVVKPRRTKVYEFESWGRGVDTAATEFLAPRRDVGTKMLKIGGELWMYMPSIERVQKISGHMLRQGLMGSDLSYEDMLEFSSWQEAYTAEVTGTEACGTGTCWVLDMQARVDDVSYPRRKIWVDQSNHIPVRQELYALSGMLLKVWLMEDVQQFGDRYYPRRMVVEDAVQEGTSTTLEFSDLQFGEEVDQRVFERRWLER
jgi:outer membrane lipoprotein-sorting protein